MRLRSENRTGQRETGAKLSDGRAESGARSVEDDVLHWQTTREEAARGRVIAASMAMVEHCVSRFRVPGGESDDLRQELLAFALNDAMLGFRGDAGSRFSSFLTIYLLRYARRWRDHERLIHIPDETLRLARHRGGGRAIPGFAENGGVPWCDPSDRLDDISGGSGTPGASNRTGGIRDSGSLSPGSPGGSQAGTGERGRASASAASRRGIAPDMADDVVGRLALGEILQRLPRNPVERRLLDMRLAGFEIDACAHRLKMRPSRVYYLLGLLRARLQKALEGKGPGDG